MKKMPAPGYFLFLAFIVFVSRASVESIMLMTFKTESILASFALIMPYFYFFESKTRAKSAHIGISQRSDRRITWEVRL